MRTTSLAFLALLVVVGVEGCSTVNIQHPTTTNTSTGAEDLAIVGVNVVHAERGSGTIDANQNVVIRGGRIVAITRDPIPEGMRTYDGRGKWLVPAYVDTHVSTFSNRRPLTRGQTLSTFKRPKPIKPIARRRSGGFRSSSKHISVPA